MIYRNLPSLRKVFALHKLSKVVLVSSAKILGKHGWALRELERAAQKKVSVIQVPDGESAKTWKILEKTFRDFSRNNLDRKSMVLAFGGGSVGDLVGFAASVYLRGIPIVQIPTTLLAQVDSSIGGKTGINFENYKNQLGSFWKPTAICIDHRFLKTLSDKQTLDGFAEIIKIGFVKDTTIIKVLFANGSRSLKNEGIIEQLIFKAIRAKQYFEQRDPYDHGMRQVINFGHTIGHAVEIKNRVSHGEAVLFGMQKELRIGKRLGITRSSAQNSFEDLIKRLGIQVKRGLLVDPEALSHDKKVHGNFITLPTVEIIGRAKLISIPTKLFLKLAREQN